MKIPSSIGDKHLSSSERSCCMLPSQRRFSCPLTQCIMEDPVSVPCCGTNFERRALLKWMSRHGCRCPESGEPLTPSDLTPNAMLQWEILYLERKNSNKVQQEKQGKQADSGSSSSSSLRATPGAPADVAPSMPRTPSTPNARKKLPPKMPRSPSTANAARETKLRKKGRTASSSSPAPPRTISSLNDTTSCHSTTAPTTKRILDLPPTRPRSSPTAAAVKPRGSTGSLVLKRVDSAPSVPLRKNADCISMELMSLFTASSSSSSCNNKNGFFTATPFKKKSNSEVISLIDDVLAILDDEQ